jgi:hypothetical protein
MLRTNLMCVFLRLWKIDNEPSTAVKELNTSVSPAPPASDSPIYSRSGRRRKLPKAYKDFVPSSLTGITSDILRLTGPATPHPSHPSEIPLSLIDSGAPNVSTPPAPPVATAHLTEPNEFGVFRCYSRTPQRDPEDEVGSAELCDSPNFAVVSAQPAPHPLQGFGRQAVAGVEEEPETSDQPWYAPFKNASVYHIMNWKYSGSRLKSNKEINRLFSIFKLPDFLKADFEDVTSVEREEQRLDEHINSKHFPSADGWRKGSVEIPLPMEGVKHKSEEDAPKFEVGGIWYRPLLGVIKSAYEDVSMRSFHLIPFKLFQSEGADIPTASSVFPTNSDCEDKMPPNSERIYTEVYTSDAMLEEDEKIRTMPRSSEDNPDIEYIIAAILLWSDSTHLTSFGTACLWPIYCLFAGLSKYLRCCPTMFAAHHLAYIPHVRL